MDPVITRLKNCWYGIPLLALPVYNLLQTITIENLEWRVSFILMMLFVAVCEELFFRGCLIWILSRWGIVAQVIGSSVLFALAHALNVFGNTEMSYMLWQMVCALVTGVCFSLISIYSGTLFVSILVHFLVNVSAPVTVEPNVAGLVVCIVIYLLYAVFVWQKIQRRK